MKIVRIIKKIIHKQLQKLKIKVPVYIPVFQSYLLENRVALVTGATSGIGKAISEAFLRSGAKVIITGRDSEKLKSVYNELIKISTDNDDVKIGILDISDITNIENQFFSILSTTQLKIDIFVNNAGLNCGNQFGKTSIIDFEKVLKTNIEGTYFFAQVQANYLKNNKIKGNILNIASSSSLRPANSPYILSKWGIRSLTLGMAKTLIKYGIVVNSIAPGPTATKMLNKEDCDDLNLDNSPAGRLCTPEEVANISVVLVSSMSQLIIGDTVYMTGGAGLLTYDDATYEL